MKFIFVFSYFFQEKVSGKYKVTGIPTLIILKPDGTTITKHGRRDVVAAQENKNFPEEW